MKPTPETFRTTTFRLAVLYVIGFEIGIAVLIGLVYWQVSSALERRTDKILFAELQQLQQTPPQKLPSEIKDLSGQNSQKLNAYGLFSADRKRLSGNFPSLSAPLRVDGAVHAYTTARHRSLRIVCIRLAGGEWLAVGRDTSSIDLVRAIMLEALSYSGGLVALIGLTAGVGLGFSSLRRLEAFQSASRRIIHGDLGVRVPVGPRRDEFDLFAETVNLMMTEIERLMGEVKGINDTIAHDLRTPLTRVRALLQHGRDDLAAGAAFIDPAISQIDSLLERFAALLRIAQIEGRARKSGFKPVALKTLLTQVAELYQPLAEEEGRIFRTELEDVEPFEADPSLLFEALSNLIDNAIKFSPEGGVITLRLRPGPQIEIEDNGPGIAPEDVALVMQRFGRSLHSAPVSGVGLGLSIVAAVARLHRLQISLDSASPGLRARLSRG